MAIMIDVAADASAHVAVCSGEVTILPAERVCFHTGDKPERIEDFVDVAAVLASGSAMTLVMVGCEHAMVRIHKCGTCGVERRYGGRP